MQQRERRLRGKERLARQVQQHRGVLADRIEQHRPGGLAGDLAQDVDALGLEGLQVRRIGRRHGVSVLLNCASRAPDGPASSPAGSSV